VARRLARLYGEGSGGSSLLVQFHPSYSYEDFVEGYRPRTIGEQPGFALVDGPLKDLARNAASDPDTKYVLVIDEVNRANLTKVMGELYFLLEYRGESVMLQYSGETFSLPENLWIICTMNTADRSIALVDAALRRRFYFIPFFPDEPPVEGLLRRWLEKADPSLLWVANVVDEANRRLGDRQVAIGPSYFLREDLTEEWVGIIWEHAVLPYVSEQFFDEEERLAEFDLRTLRSAVARTEGIESDETPYAP
jgi:5-methylcytosine-specific restriction enzyme B